MQALMKYKKWIIGIVILLISFVLYGIFFTDSSQQSGGSLVTTTTNAPGLVDSTDGNNNQLSAQIISALNQIESLRLDPAIFDDPVYRSLQDRSRPLPEERVGKSNPFDPIGGPNTDPLNRNNQQGQDDKEDEEVQTGPRGPQTIINTRQQGI